jgi:hypothetical protein
VRNLIFNFYLNIPVAWLLNVAEDEEEEVE